MWKRIIPIGLIFAGGALFCMGTLGQGVYHGVPYLEPRQAPFLGQDDTQWHWDNLSHSECMMLWGIVVAACGAVSMLIITVVRAARRR
jgi:hypothetical protein